MEAPESGSWERVVEPAGKNWRSSPVYLESLLGNGYVRERMDSYAVHSYRANLERKKAFGEYFFARYPGTESEESELYFAKGVGASTFDAYETSKANDLKAVSRGVKSNRHSFPAESVTTLVIKEFAVKGNREHSFLSKQSVSHSGIAINFSK